MVPEEPRMKWQEHKVGQLKPEEQASLLKFVVEKDRGTKVVKK